MVVSGKTSSAKNLIPSEPIEFTHYPVWEQQPYEMSEWFEVFQEFYLILPSRFRTINRAYNNCAEVAGEKIEKTKNKRAKTVDRDWVLAHKMYRWEDRAREYWLKKIQDQEGYVDSILQKIREKTLLITLKSFDKIEAMTNYPISRKQITSVDENGNPLQITIEPNGNWSHRDAPQMAKTLTETLEKVLGFNSLEYALNVVQKNGLTVVDLEGKIVGGMVSQNTDTEFNDLASIIRDSADNDDDVLVPMRIVEDESDEDGESIID